VFVLVALSLSFSFVRLAVAADSPPAAADPGLVEQGRYLAAAGDCAGCHGPSLKGGDPVATPIGAVYASNITPDRSTGIGSWTLEQFSDALRKGRAPGGPLYPAMPYTAYTGLSDADMRALYAYFMLGVKAVSNTPPESDLPFPFYRAAMAPWNALFLTQGQPTGAVSVSGEQRLRGRLLVETLGHCSACHSPRGTFMQQRGDRHLAGAMVGGWRAPNITPDATGIGGWSDEKLATFLRTGHTDLAVAAGEMGTVVSRSLSKLTPGDIGAVVAYLRAVPRVASQQPARSDTATAPTAVAGIENPTNLTDWQMQLGHSTRQGDVLYQSACASCHGVDGKGSAGLVHPSLHLVNSVSNASAATLVQVIAHGVDRTVGNRHALMPPFRSTLDDGQIASVANFVRTQFGGVKSDLSDSQTAAILEGGNATPWPIRYAKPLAIAAIFVFALIPLLIVWQGSRAFAKRRP
jgi:mono/diheme cytochrome c family protein